MNESITQQGCGAGAEAILDGWSQSQTLLDGGSEAWNLGSGSTWVVCGTSELRKNNNVFSDFRTKLFWRRNRGQKLLDVGAGAWNLSTGYTALVHRERENLLALSLLCDTCYSTVEKLSWELLIYCCVTNVTEQQWFQPEWKQMEISVTQASNGFIQSK